MVEKWLLQVEDMMINSIRYVIKDATEDYVKTPRKQWVVEWPGQVVICSSQVYWTAEAEAAIQSNSLPVRIGLLSIFVSPVEFEAFSSFSFLLNSRTILRHATDKLMIL